MKIYIFVGALGALFSGLAIGVQSTLSSRIGIQIGVLRTGMLMNLAGGIIGGLFFLALWGFRGPEVLQVPRTALVYLLIGGLLGVFIVGGVSFSLTRIGVTAGVATIILGQLFVSTLADSSGWGGVEPIPLTFPRIAGLILMALAVALLLPKNP